MNDIFVSVHVWMTFKYVCLCGIVRVRLCMPVCGLMCVFKHASLWANVCICSPCMLQRVSPRIVDLLAVLVSPHSCLGDATLSGCSETEPRKREREGEGVEEQQKDEQRKQTEQYESRNRQAKQRERGEERESARECERGWRGRNKWDAKEREPEEREECARERENKRSEWVSEEEG